MSIQYPKGVKEFAASSDGSTWTPNDPTMGILRVADHQSFSNCVGRLGFVVYLVEPVIIFYL